MDEPGLADRLAAGTSYQRLRVLQQCLQEERNVDIILINPIHYFDKAFPPVLKDTAEVRGKCIEVIHELALLMDKETLDECMSMVMKHLLLCPAEHTSLQSDVVRTLRSYLHRTSSLRFALDLIREAGLESRNEKVQMETTKLLPLILKGNENIKENDLGDLIKTLIRKLTDDLYEAKSRDTILNTLNGIKDLVGETAFEDYLQGMAAPLRKTYHKATNGTTTPRNSYVVHIEPERSPHYVLANNTVSPYPTVQLHYGIIPDDLMVQMDDESNFRARADAVESIKNLVIDADLNRVMPHLLQFINFLNNLLDDPNFKIITVTLEIVAVLVDHLNFNVQPYLKHFISVLTKRMMDPKIVVRQSIMKVVMRLMQILSPSSVLSILCDNLHHRNSRIRQETINIVIASLLTYPSVDFDLQGLCQTVSPMLVDSKRTVRQAALECFAVLAQAMGAGKLIPLVSAVDTIELSPDGEGVMAAVQARLARRQLPRLNVDGLVDYACPHPTSAKSRGSSQPQGADMEWILAASSGSGSARSVRSEPTQTELETARTDSARQNGKTPPRRFYSAGKRKNKLPWQEAVQSSDDGTSDSAQPVTDEQPEVTNEMPPLKPRPTWIDDSPRPVRRTPRKPEPVVQTPGQNQNQGSYKQLYLNRKQTQAEMAKSMIVPRRSIPVPENTTRSEKGLPLSVASTPAKKKTHDGLDDWMRSSVSPQTPKPVLDPIGVAHDSPIPLKPTLVRGPSSRRSKVPPIQNERKPDDENNGYSPGVYANDVAQQTEQDMSSSLKQIRNSATRKRAEKLFERQDSGRSSQYDDLIDRDSPSPSTSPDRDTAYHSSSNTSERTPSVVETERIARRHDSWFERKVSNGLVDDEMDGRRLSHPPPSESQINGPNAERRSSLVEIVGRGYSDECERAPVGAVPPRIRDRRKMTRAPLMSPMGMSSMFHPGLDKTDDCPYDDMGVVGKGILDRRLSNELPRQPTPADTLRSERSGSKLNEQPLQGVYGVGLKEKTDTGYLSSQPLSQALPIPVPIPIPIQESERQSQLQSDDEVNIAEYDSDFSDDDDDDDDDDFRSMSISRTLRESMERRRLENEKTPRQSELDKQRAAKRLKQQEREREREDRKRKQDDEREERRRKEEEERSQMREENRRKVEEQRQQEQRERLRQLSAGSDTKRQGLTNGATSGRSPNKQAFLSPGGVQSTGDVDINAEIKPHPKPEHAIQEALRSLNDDDWMVKVEGLTLIRRVAQFNPDTMNSNLHTIILAVINEVKNLRSQVSRLAIVTLSDMFTYCRRNMEPDLDLLAKVLLAKNGETNGFIKEDVEKALSAMIGGVTPQKALIALIIGGSSHRNVAVRRTTAQFLYLLVEKMGPGRILSGVKDITDRVLPTAAQFVTDSSPETRYYGRCIFHLLVSHQDFDKILWKYVPAATCRNIADTLESVKTKGPGEKPAEALSARSRRSGQGSRSGSLTRGNSAQSDTSGVISNYAPSTPSTGPAPAPTRSRPQLQHKTDEQTMNEIKLLMTQLGANDWKERHQAIVRFQDMCQTNPEDISANIIKIFDKFGPRLQDSNSKVNLFALQAMLAITPALADALGPVVNTIVQGVAPNLSSKNKDINTTAADLIDSFMINIDPCVLLQPFANQGQCGNPRSKPTMVDKTAVLVPKVYARKPRQVHLHVLPLLWHLLNQCSGSGAVSAGSGNIRSSTEKLAKALYQQMGQALIDNARSSEVSPRCVQVLLSMTEKT